MAEVLKGNAVVGQSGGPTAVINQSLVGVVETLRGAPGIEQILGCMNGVRGIVEDRFTAMQDIPQDRLERIAQPEKNWKFSANDSKEREYWDDYMDAYEDMIRNTATKAAPWYVVPADNKWFTRVIVASAVIEALDELDLKYPTVGPSKLKELAAAERALKGGK